MILLLLWTPYCEPG